MARSLVSTMGVSPFLPQVRPACRWRAHSSSGASALPAGTSHIHQLKAYRSKVAPSASGFSTMMNCGQFGRQRKRKATAQCRCTTRTSAVRFECAGERRSVVAGTYGGAACARRGDDRAADAGACRAAAQRAPRLAQTQDGRRRSRGVPSDRVGVLKDQEDHPTIGGMSCKARNARQRRAAVRTARSGLRRAPTTDECVATIVVEAPSAPSRA
jgi:hypothetical protein